MAESFFISTLNHSDLTKMASGGRRTSLARTLLLFICYFLLLLLLFICYCYSTLYIVTCGMWTLLLFICYFVLNCSCYCMVYLLLNICYCIFAIEYLLPYICYCIFVIVLLWFFISIPTVYELLDSQILLLFIFYFS